ncbi:MAG TPA: carbamoyltransferase C-terminal domain-containing protein, partial [Chloroflexota bacterium]|nr:carbamoyltransferase C-terminal domain-containing protein [Chloroflexota bacterium]
GRGEKATTSYWAGSGTTIEPLGEVQMPHSLGLLYERVTEYLGFLHSSDEYKVMALASFGSPTQIDEFRRMVRLGRGGDYSVLPAHLERLFGPRRARGEPFERRHFDVARSLQLILEETVLELARRLRESSGLEHLCLAGGVALNCVMNARIRDSGLFREVWVQPAAGDAGTALGSALAVDAAQREPRSRSYRMNDVYLGPEYSDDEIQQLLDTSRLAYRRLDDVPSAGAELLSEGKVIGWFQGRMEFGPRALGNRSILASPASPGMQATLNEIKDREDFRPVAPVVLEDRLEEWFTPPVASPFMLFVHDVAPGKETQVPAIRHVDGTARIQTVNRRQNPRYYDLIAAFGDRTGVPVLVNTSFNTRGKPMVCSPRDAVECFMTTPLDALIIGPYLLQK